MKMKELESLLREARQILNDWCEEYGHHDLEVMRDKIDDYFLAKPVISLTCNCVNPNSWKSTGGWFCPVHGHCF